MVPTKRKYGRSRPGKGGRSATGRNIGLSATLFSAGILLFSGSIFGLVLFELRWLGPVTPIGGVCLLAGWASLLVLVRPM